MVESYWILLKFHLKKIKNNGISVDSWFFRRTGNRNRSLLLLFVTSLSMLAVAVIKQHNHKQLGEEKVSFAYTSTSHSIIKGRQNTGIGQQPGGRDWSRSHGGMLLSTLLLVTCSACMQPNIICLGMAPCRVGWAFPHQSLNVIKKMSHMLALKPIWWGHFLNRGNWEKKINLHII